MLGISALAVVLFMRDLEELLSPPPDVLLVSLTGITLTGVEPLLIVVMLLLTGVAGDAPMTLEGVVTPLLSNALGVALLVTDAGSPLSLVLDAPELLTLVVVIAAVTVVTVLLALTFETFPLVVDGAADPVLVVTIGVVLGLDVTVLRELSPPMLLPACEEDPDPLPPPPRVGATLLFP